MSQHVYIIIKEKDSTKKRFKMRIKLIYGSTAMKHWFPTSREPQSLDIISNLSQDRKKQNSDEEQYYWIPSFKYLKHNIDEKYIDADLLYTIKVSHVAWDVNWSKTMKDIAFLKNQGCKINIKFYNLLIRDWTRIYGKKNVTMNVTNEEFFNENAERKISRIELHQIFKIGEKPMYEKIRENPDLPAISTTIWLELSEEDKFNYALEEFWIRLLEEYSFTSKAIPFMVAKFKVLKEMIIFMSGGIFNVYLIENFDKLYEESKFDDEMLKKLHILCLEYGYSGFYLDTQANEIHYKIRNMLKGIYERKVKAGFLENIKDITLQPKYNNDANVIADILVTTKEYRDKIYDFRLEDEFNSYDDTGNYSWKIFKLTSRKGILYFRIRGWYNAWNGMRWGNTIELLKNND